MRMRRKKSPTRRRGALTWLAGLAVLTAACHFLGVYCLTPERALKRLETAEFTGPTEFLQRVAQPPGIPQGRGELRLAGGADALFLARYRLQWNRGWATDLVEVAERDHDRPFTADYYDMWSSGDWTEESPKMDYPYIYGCVESAEVEKLVIQFDALEGGHSQTVELTAADWIAGEDGGRFFLCQLEPEIDNTSRQCSVTGYYADGAATKTLYLLGGIEQQWK